MVALNFDKQFASPVEQRIKRQTIRAKARCKPGDALQLYTGMRTKACRKLGPDEVCKSVEQVVIYENKVGYQGRMIDLPAHLDSFAIADGFPNFHAMLGWFSLSDQGLPFTGDLIKW